MTSSEKTSTTQATTLHGRYPHFVGIISLPLFLLWLTLLLADFLYNRPGQKSNTFLMGSVFWITSILGASPAAFFSLHFGEQTLEFRSFGRPTLTLRYEEITWFEYPYPFWGRTLRIHFANTRRDIYWIDYRRAADLLRAHGVEQREVRKIN